MERRRAAIVEEASRRATTCAANDKGAPDDTAGKWCIANNWGSTGRERLGGCGSRRVEHCRENLAEESDPGSAADSAVPFAANKEWRDERSAPDHVRAAGNAARVPQTRMTLQEARQTK